ncbi:hypothetical protein FAGAP_13162 [Fusarium agapanthi]|uniref:Uncharacterized protein n=1 Tax=Fusarium agapanthi TaxID=1803897 RepID=A0A9P5AXE2_9HYPO|nr:hypothetical protein FAGAP_13162 [Fusarium agapanthi]
MATNSWGPLVNVGEKSKGITGKFTALNCTNQGGEVLTYKPDKAFTLEADEDLTLTGNPDDTNTVTFSGKSSGESDWKLSKDK